MNRFPIMPCAACQKPIADRPDRQTPYCLQCTTTNRCKECGQIKAQQGEHLCNGIDVRGPRHCLDCARLLNNQNSERWKNRCTTCAAKRSKPASRKIKADFRAAFGNKCCRCGYDRCSAALHFHHIDSSEKYLYSPQGRLTLRELREHPERFELLCANCHTEEHRPEYIKDKLRLAA